MEEKNFTTEDTESTEAKKKRAERRRRRTAQRRKRREQKRAERFLAGLGMTDLVFAGSGRRNGAAGVMKAAALGGSRACKAEAP